MEKLGNRAHVLGKRGDCKTCCSLPCLDLPGSEDSKQKIELVSRAFQKRVKGEKTYYSGKRSGNLQKDRERIGENQTLGS